MGYSNLLAEDKKLVTYRPRLNKITGSVTATVLLQQIIFHADNVGNRPFYKFRNPCSHKLYREGDSWTEELGFSPAEFDTARSKIATRVMKGDSKTEAMRGETANHLVIYWTDASRITWYLLNVDLLNRMLEKLYANSRNSNYQENRETPNSVIQESEITRKLEKLELPLSETTTKITIEDTEKTQANFPEKIKKADPLMQDLERQTLEARAEAQGNYAAPSQAGGSFAIGEVLTTAACARLGRSEPEGKKHDSARAFFEKALRTEGLLQGDIATLTWAVRDWLDPEGEYAFFLPQYDLNPKHELALRHFGIVLSKAKKQAGEADARRARDIEATEASVAALEDRRAARSPPPEDDEVGRDVKGILKGQMDRHLFEKYVQPCRFTAENSALLCAVPDANKRNWLEGNLREIISRALAGVGDGPKEIRFEVKR